MIRKMLTATMIAAAISGTARASDQTPLDLMFYTPHFETTDRNAELSYIHTRRSGLPQRVGPDLENRISVALQSEGDDIETVVTLDTDGAARRLDRFQGVPGNPILMVFMETLVGSISRATGGSPFYLRNRIKDSFANGDVVSVGDRSTITLQPFENDRNRERMGPFADMTISMELDRGQPGMFAFLVAKTEPNPDEIYFEEIRFETAN